MAAKFEAFGYAVRVCDGNDVGALMETFDRIPSSAGRPNLIIANTIKGKGVSFIQNTVQWHHNVPYDEQLAQAMEELDRAALELEKV